jgi:hypothetical protein
MLMYFALRKMLPKNSVNSTVDVDAKPWERSYENNGYYLLVLPI